MALGQTDPGRSKGKNYACNQTASELFEMVREEDARRNEGVKWRGKSYVEYYNLLTERYVRLRRNIPREMLEAPLLG